MLITSPSFALFVAVVLAAYFLLPRRPQVWLLLVASYVLYGTWSWQFPPALLALTVLNWAIGRRLWSAAGHRTAGDLTPRRRVQAVAPTRRRWIVVGIALNVVALALLKYAGFFAPAVLRALGVAGDGTTGKIVTILLPIGFSYRVLENISFLVDASRRQLDAFPRLDDYALYVAWFPKLVSGPIERGRAFLRQLPAGRVVDNDALARAISLVLLGLTRKILVADTLRGLIPGALFSDGPARGGVHLLVWLVAEVFVVYNDFAGYTDIARGVSALFGIELSRNFAAPFFARNFSELWLRWHMSLSFWLRDYVYMPVSRALLRRSPRANTPVNLLVPPLAAMLVSALWHQASGHMLLWGLLWGAFLVVGRVPTLWRPVVPPDRRPAWRQGLGMLGVLAMLTFSNLLFHMDVAGAWHTFVAVFGRGRWTGAMTEAWLLVALSLGIDAFQHRSKDETVFSRWPLWARSLALAVVILALFLATRARVAEPFIYQFF